MAYPNDEVGTSPAKRQMTLQEFIEQAGDKLGVPKSLRDAIFERESNVEHYRPDGSVKLGPSTRHGRAIGVGQLLAGTAQRHGVDPYDPIDNVYGALKEQKRLYDKYLASTNDPNKAALLTAAGYNAGEGAVDKYGTVPPYKETQDYVRFVAGHIKRNPLSPSSAELVRRVEPVAASVSDIANQQPTTPEPPLIRRALPAETVAPDVPIQPEPGRTDEFAPYQDQGLLTRKQAQPIQSDIVSEQAVRLNQATREAAEQQQRARARALRQQAAIQRGRELARRSKEVQGPMTPFSGIPADELEAASQQVGQVPSRSAAGSGSGELRRAMDRTPESSGVMGDFRKMENIERRRDKEIRPRVIDEYFHAGGQNILQADRERVIASDPKLQQYIAEESQRRAQAIAPRQGQVDRFERGAAGTLSFMDKLKDIGSNPAQLVPFLQSAKEIDNLLLLGAAADRAEQGKGTEEDHLLVKEFIAKAKQKTSTGHDIASTLAMLPAFVGEFALTGGAYTAGKKAAVAGLDRLISKAALETIEKKTIGRVGSKVVTGLVGGAAQTIPAGLTRIPAGALYRHETTGEDFPSALGNAFADQLIEVTSERAGGILKHVPVPKRLTAIRDALTSRWLKSGKTMPALEAAIKKTGWNGVLGEIFEERVGDVARYAIGQQTSLIPTLHQLAVEGIAFSIPGVAVGLGRRALSRTPSATETPAQAESKTPPASATSLPVQTALAEAASKETASTPEPETPAVPARSELAPSRELPQLVRMEQVNSTQAKLEFTRQEGTVSDADLKALFPEYHITVRRVRPFMGGSQIQEAELTFWNKEGTRQVKVPADLAQRFGLAQPFGRGQEAVPKVETPAVPKVILRRESKPTPAPVMPQILPAQEKSASAPLVRPMAEVGEIVRPIARGRESKAVTDRGTEVNTRYAIVEAKDLVTSHDAALNPNPRFSAELQPRDRGRAASADQINRIASNLRPEFLGESPKASEGAPIMGPDRIVESGNARTIALGRAYRSGNEGSKAYKKFLLDNAERFGLDRKAIEAAKEPVLVRERISEVDRPQFVREANEQSVASMSAAEQARSDSRKLTGTLIDQFAPSESGEINTSANVNFVRAFMRDVVGPNEIGRYVSGKGELSQEGIGRIRNAIFARAYGDSPEGLRALEKLSESPENNVRNITTAMLQKAGQFASLKEAIERGERYPLDLTPDLSKAMAKLSSLREQGMTAADYLNQGALFGEDLTPLQKQALWVFDEYKRSGKAINGILDNYIKGAEAAGNPKQQGFFGDNHPQKEALFDAAVREAIDDANRQISLLPSANQGLFSDPASGRGIPPTYPESKTIGREPQNLTRGESAGSSLTPLDLAPRAQGPPDSAIEERFAGFPFLRSLFSPKPRNIGVNVPPTASDFAEVEERWKAAKGIKVPGGLRKAREALARLGHGFRRHYIHLDPNKDAQTALTTDILRLHEASPAWATAIAYDHLVEITGDLNDQAMDVFTRNIVLPDILKDVEEGLYNVEDTLRELPFGYTSKEQVEQDLAKFKALAEANPAIKKAIDRRKGITSTITRRLVGLDLLNPEVLEDDRYYHRQVMKYVNAQDFVSTGAGGGVRLSRKGFQKERVGGGDFNTRYQEAEFEWLAQAHSLIAKRETLDQLNATNNIVDDLKREAKALNTAALARKFGSEEPAEIKRTRSAIGRANAELKEMAQAGNLSSANGRYDGLIDELSSTPDREPFTHPDWFSFLSHLMENDLDGKLQAAMIFKAIAEREAFIKEELGKEFKTWQDLVPDTHTEWQPEKGNLYYLAPTVEEKALGRILAGEKTLEQEDVRNQLVMGGRKKQWVIPKELALTLDGIRRLPTDDPVENLWVMGQNTWKQWVLLSPARVLIYNLNNISGDVDIALAVEPRVMKEFRRAAADLWRYQVTGRTSPGLKSEIQEALKLGVLQTGLTVQEIPDINKAGAFRALVAEEEGLIAKGVLQYWNSVKNFTTWRENIMRLAAYRYTLQQWEADKPFYAVSNKNQIDALHEIKPKAAKVAREWIGDYGNISVAGQWMRRHMIPFYSWTEINAPRYVRLLRNTIRDTNGQTGSGSRAGKGFRFGTMTAAKVAKLYLTSHILLGLISLWNHLMFPDEEKELRREGRKPHIVLGRADDGSIRTLKFQGALADALEWFGLDDYPSDIANLLSGRRDWQDQAAEAVKAPAERLVNSLEPFSKSTFELATGRQLYPHFFREGKSFEFAARPIRDRGEYLSRVFSVSALYKRITDKPVRPISKDPVWGSLESFLVYRTDPGEAAYWEIRGRLNEWQEKRGKVQMTSDPTERGNALYYFKQASKWGDDKAAVKWLKRYRELGGTDKGLISSIRTAHPLGSLARKDWTEFAQTLTPEERLMLKQSIHWYKKTYGDVPAEDSEGTLQEAVDRAVEGERGGSRRLGPRPPTRPGMRRGQFGEFEIPSTLGPP